ncbi:hypothetical protein BKA61DRAFT_673740 [Leptodontidium sp. MPI-SDFR-AT-0119]|nr:hypothetical protein BKA61DRAFT_673740 [Leptodontidium sp. MPI-SDFR-AT-0119]
MRSYNGTDNSTTEVSWLLIFDNVNNFDILTDFWPQHDNSGSIIVTSREHVVKIKAYHIEEGIDLPPLKKEEASNLLLKLTWHEDIPEEQELSLEAAEILGGLPLAMTQMAGVMNRKSLSSANFLNRYKEEESRQKLFSLSLKPKIRRTTYGHTLATVWALEELKHSSGLLDVMSYLDPGGIYKLYLQDTMGNVQLSDYPKTTTAYQDARSELLDSSLVNRSTDRFHKSSLTIHRLIQDGARAKMSLERAEETFSAAVEILCLQWPAAQTGVRHHIARWQEYEKLSPHILRLKDRFAKAGSGFRSRWITNLSFATILNELGWYERGYTDQAVECYEIARTNVEHIINTIQRQASASQTKTNNINKPLALLAEVHNNLAGAATEFNDGKTALHHFTIYNKMQLDSQGAKSNTSDSRLTSSFFNLGLSYAMTEDYDQAILSFEQAMVEASKLLKPTRINTVAYGCLHGSLRDP